MQAKLLILTLCGASEWLLYNGQWISSHPNQYDIQNPLIGFSDREWKDFTKNIIGLVIYRAEFCIDCTKLYLQSNGCENLLEIPKDTKIVPKHRGSLEYRTWGDEDQRLAWVLSKSGKLNC